MTTDAQRQRAVMFADVAGSSTLYKQLGDVQAKALVGRAVAMMSEVTGEHSGTVVKTVGDAAMARFDRADQAAQAAVAIQERSASLGQDPAISVRIGISFGATLQEGVDLFGETVNDAAYVAGIARGRQIVVTESMVQALGPEHRARCQEFDHVALKGATQGSTLYRLIWEKVEEPQAAATVMMAESLQTEAASGPLILSHGSRIWRLSPGDTPFRIGRDPDQTELRLDVSHASRDHCHILYRRGRFVLSDHSTNGTYLKARGQPEVFLRREETPMAGRGVISLGQPSAAAFEGDLIRYDLGS